MAVEVRECAERKYLLGEVDFYGLVDCRAMSEEDLYKTMSR
jgi:hypothetical protein